jgi:hypothetical protein
VGLALTRNGEGIIAAPDPTQERVYSFLEEASPELARDRHTCVVASRMRYADPP